MSPRLETAAWALSTAPEAADFASPAALSRPCGEDASEIRRSAVALASDMEGLRADQPPERLSSGRGSCPAS